MMSVTEYGALSGLVCAIPEPLFDLPLLEIGAGIGGSTKVIAQSLIASRNKAILHSVDDYTMDVGRVSRLSGTSDQYMAVKTAIKDFDNVQLHRMSSSQAFRDLHQVDRLSFCLIDGDHRYETVLEDLGMWSRRIAYGGILVLHDIGKPVLTWGMSPTSAYLKWIAAAPTWRVILQADSLLALHRSLSSNWGL